MIIQKCKQMTALLLKAPNDASTRNTSVWQQLTSSNIEICPMAFIEETGGEGRCLCLAYHAAPLRSHSNKHGVHIQLKCAMYLLDNAYLSQAVGPQSYPEKKHNIPHNGIFQLFGSTRILSHIYLKQHRSKVYIQTN